MRVFSRPTSTIAASPLLRNCPYSAAPSCTPCVRESLAEFQGIAPSSCGPAVPDSSDGAIAYRVRVLMKVTASGTSALEPRQLCHVGPHSCCLSAKLRWTCSWERKTESTLVESNDAQMIVEHTSEFLKTCANPQVAQNRDFNLEKGDNRMRSKADLHHLQSLHIGSAFSLPKTPILSGLACVLLPPFT